MTSAKEDVLSELAKWSVTSGFYVNPSLELKYDTKTNQNKVMAKDDINKDDLMITCPEDYVIGPRLARELYGLTHMIDIQPFIKLALLHEASLKSKSKWAPYIKALPLTNEMTHPFFFEENALKLIEGTNLASALKEKIKMWEQEFELVIDYLTESDAPEELGDKYTFDEYFWASLIFTSRSFPSRLIYPDEKNDTLSVLIPMVDMLNHKPQLPINWNIDPEGFKLISGSTIKRGDEVFNNYGAKGNEELLLAYGFCIKDNPFDNVPLKLRLGSPSPPQTQAQAAINNSDTESSSLFYLGRGGVPDNLIESFVKLITLENEYTRTDSVLAQAHSLAALAQALTIKSSKITELTSPFDAGNVQQIFSCWYTEGVRVVYQKSIEDCAKRLDALITQAISNDSAYVLNLDTMITYYKDDAQVLLNALLEFYGLGSVDDLIANDLEDEAIQLYLTYLFLNDKIPLPGSRFVDPQQYDAFENQFKDLIPAFSGPKWISTNLARLAEYWSSSFQSVDKLGRPRQTLVLEI